MELFFVGSEGSQRGAGTEEMREKPDSSVRGGRQRGAGTEEIREKPKSPYVVGASEVPVRRKLEKSQNLRTWRKSKLK